MVDLCRSGRALEVEVDIESCEELEKMDVDGEDGWDSGSLKERVKVVDDGGVGKGIALRANESAGWGESIWEDIVLDMLDLTWDTGNMIHKETQKR